MTARSRLDRGTRRIALCGLTTLGAVVLLFSYRTSTSAELPDAAGNAAADAGSSGTGATAAAAVPAAVPAAGSGAGSGEAPSGRPGWSGTVTGPVVQVKWGQVQVRATLRQGRITAVDVLRHPDENARDRQINAAAVPQLVSETLQVQSARIDMVSGATFTSTGYVQSLQAALDRAGTT
ncbi:FMN-binding protein [Actinomycetospora sp. TBRC 11914]|uniref:FMN-binding protein n=1 Tax=Actinomycetospora sp. TBRC 11914 TaxID=2729387 RepID=UPI00145DF258|nr:FMN-binding protein [Actinomycetospora sp. TBRC 11914]NMO91983.1 FMN-binding protein [Actinomycetospora sp. TBRC 11914]